MTSEALKQKFYEILFFNKEKYDTDDANFVIPYVSMNDGHTPAQIRYEDDGIYHDIPRSPFKRVTGKIGEDGKIPDIDITSLVKYGSLEQAKIAPTLENVDIKLYFREPNLKKVKNNTKNTGLYADSYIWREAQPGFHLYNNDTLYGYEWIVVQDEYSSMDGVYNLQMNIEDGLGICKLAGTQAPISLKGVQYKVIITAKNLWTREYSLMEDTFPILTNLDSDSDDFAPSLNAVKKYYREKVVTKNAVVDETLTVAEKTTIDEKGVNTNSIKTKDIEVEGKEIVYKEDLLDHINNTVKNPAKDEKDELRGPHGIANEGIDGNIDAKTLDGLELGTGARSVTQNKKFPAYVPFVDEDNFIGFGNDFGFFTKRNSKDEPATKLANLNLVAGRAPINSVMQDAFIESLKINGADFSGFVKTLVISNENFNIAYVPGNTPTIEITSGVAFSNNVEVKVGTVSAKSMITDSLKIGSATLNKDNILPLLNGSSIAYKRVISELLPYNVKEAASSYLEPNLKYDADGELVHGLETMDIEGNNLLVSPDLKNHIPTDSEVLSKDKAAFDKLGSALQAIYEMPMASYVYKRGQDEYKQQLGILIERVNQIRDTIEEARGPNIDEFDPKNYVVHKRNSMVKSSVRNVGAGKSEGVGALTEDRVLQNAYTYSDEEIKSIIHYLDLTTSKKELQQEIRNTVGILLKAAKETQERLLNVETSIFGWDSPTIPGPNEDREAFINSHIDESLRDSINNSSMLLGLNRLVRAICLELFDTADLERIEAEEESRVTDTENSKVSVKTRMDQIDEVMSVLYNQSSAVVKYYMENVINDEAGHSYVDMYTAKNAQIISEEGQEEADLKINGVSHDLYKDSYDEGRKWKNLASKEELSDASKAEVGFAQVSKNAHKHSPNESETGIVRIPSVVKKNSEDISEGEIEHEDVSKYLENNKVLRNWQLFKVDKTKNSIADDYAANGTYAPIFKSKLVAWESAKVERMNLKLSELTRAVYGVDDVVASFPNRTEVLRRNITNLVDDLYPNRSFSVEHKVDIQGDATAEIYKPFKKSNKTLSENFESGKLVSKENPSVDEGSLETHKSIIPYFDSEIFNFTIENHFKGKGLKTGKAGSEYKEGKQIDMGTQNRIIFKTDNLVTDEIPFNDKYGTYHNAFSRIDMLEDILGVENAYISSLYEDNILSTGDYLNVLSGPASGTNEQKVADYKKEISIYSYEISRIESDIKNIEEFLNSYLVNWTSIDGEILKKKADKSSVESKIKDNEEETESLRLSNAELLNSINSTETSLKAKEGSLKEKEEEKSKTEKDIESHETQISNLKAQLNLLSDAMGEASTQVEETNKWSGFKSNIESAVNDLRERETLINQIKAEDKDTIDLPTGEFTRSAGYIASPDLRDRSTWEGPNGEILVFDRSSVSDSDTGASEIPQTSMGLPAEDADLSKLSANTELVNIGGSYTYKYIKQGNIEYRKELTKRQSTRRRPYRKEITSPDGLPTLYTANNDVITVEETSDGIKFYCQTPEQWEACVEARKEADYYKILSDKLNKELSDFEAKEAESEEELANITDQRDNAKSSIAKDLLEKLLDEDYFEAVSDEEDIPLALQVAARAKYIKELTAAKAKCIKEAVSEFKTNYNNLPTGEDFLWDSTVDAQEILDFINSLSEKEVTTKIGNKDVTIQIKPNGSSLIDVDDDDQMTVDDLISKMITDCQYGINIENNYQTALSNHENDSKVVEGYKEKCEETFKNWNYWEEEYTTLSNARTELDRETEDVYFDDLNFRSYTLKYQFVKKDSDGKEKYNKVVTLENINCEDDVLPSYVNSVTGESSTNYADVEKVLTEIDDEWSLDATFIGNSFDAGISAEEDRLVEEYNSLSKNLNDLINEKEDLSNELIVIKDEIVELNKQIDSLKETLSGLESQNSGVSNKLNELNEELNSLNAEKSQIESKIVALETDKKNLEDKKVSQETKLEELKKDRENAENSLEAARANLAVSSGTNNALPYFVGELNFLDFSVVVDNKPAGPNTPSLSLLSSTDVSFVLSRKSKRIQERVTTTEAFLDSLTQGLHYGNYLLKTLEEQSESKSTKDINERFEQTEVKNILKRICEVSELKQTGNSVFDLDLSESFEGCEEHNRKVWQRVPYSLDVTKSNYTTESDGITGKYEIKGKLVAEPDLFPYGEEKYRLLKGTEWTIHVNYVSSVPSELDKDTIYLKLKVSDNNSLYSKFVKAEDVPVTPNVLNSGSFQNQTEYNIYKTLKNLFTSLFTLKNEEQNLYYQMMLRAHPVGSIFASFDNNFNPAAQFGGTWVKLERAALYSGNSANPDFTNITMEDISHKHNYAFGGTFYGSVDNHSHTYTQGWYYWGSSGSWTGGSAPGCHININVAKETDSNSVQNRAYILNVWVRTGAL